MFNIHFAYTNVYILAEILTIFFACCIAYYKIYSAIVVVQSTCTLLITAHEHVLPTMAYIATDVM